MHFAGFRRRFAAYVLDIIPITTLVGLVFYLFFGFDTTLGRYASRRGDDLEARREFLIARNHIRDLSGVLYLVYCGVMESSSLRGTFGKRLMGITVVNADGSPLTFAQAAKRNSVKSLAFGLGCFRVAWSKHKQGWHDLAAGTFVVRGDAGRRPGSVNDETAGETTPPSSSER